MMQNYFLKISLLFLLLSCTEDREIKSNLIENPNLEVIHYWDFNSITFTSPTITIGGAIISYLGTSFDKVEEGSNLNLKENSESGSALRLRNPAGDFTVKMPTLGYKNIVLTYATMRTNNGAKIQTVQYSLDGINFTEAGLQNNSFGVATAFQLKQFDFSTIAGVNNNPNFTIKLVFSDGDSNDSGNNRIDNWSLEGEVDETYVPQNFLIYYWSFNNLPEGTISNPILSDESLLTPNNANISYIGTGLGFVDRYTPGTTINARNGALEGFGIRFRNPSNTRDLIIQAPTTGYKNIIVKYATFRTNSGAQTQNYSYTTDGVNYITTGLGVTSFEVPVEPNYEMVTLDFSSISGVNNNPNFKIKVSFTGSNAAGTSGNNRLDNLTVEGNLN